MGDTVVMPAGAKWGDAHEPIPTHAPYAGRGHRTAMAMTHAPAVTGSRLWLVRHAAPLVAPGTCYGALDVPADAQDTRAAAERLATALPAGALVGYSTLQRCELLAHDLIGLRPDLALKPAAELVEFDFGRWEGRAWDDIARTDIDAWTADFAHYRPGGGDNLAAMLERVSNALGVARQACAQGTDVLWITHAGVARCVQWLLRHGRTEYRRNTRRLWTFQMNGLNRNLWLCWRFQRSMRRILRTRRSSWMIRR